MESDGAAAMGPAEACVWWNARMRTDDGESVSA